MVYEHETQYICRRARGREKRGIAVTHIPNPETTHQPRAAENTPTAGETTTNIASCRQRDIKALHSVVHDTVTVVHDTVAGVGNIAHETTATSLSQHQSYQQAHTAAVSRPYSKAPPGIYSLCSSRRQTKKTLPVESLPLPATP